MVNTLTAIRLGYGGFGTLNGTTVLVTSGSMDNSVNIQHQSAYLLPNDKSSRSRILHADGTVTHSGSISFDLTNSALSAVKGIMDRGSSFSVGLYDGTYGMRMTNCYATSITLNGSPSGLLTATVAFMSDSPATKQNNSNITNSNDLFTSDLIPYWWSGNSYVRDWSFTFNQNITPKYANKNEYKLRSEGILASSPLYLFIGEIDVSLDFTTYCPLIADRVSISNSTFRITGRTTSSGYVLGSQNDLGMYKYNITSHALGSNDQNMLFVT